MREVRREAKLSKVSTRQLKFAELQEEGQQELMVANRQKKARAKQSLEDRLAAEEEEGAMTAIMGPDPRAAPLLASR